MREPVLLRQNAAGYPEAQGLYDYRNERDACGVGFVAKLDNNPTHRIVADGIQILLNLEHRGATGGDKKTGDGAGIMVRVPDRFLRREVHALGHSLPEAGHYGVAMVFLPSQSFLAERCAKILEQACAAEGLKVITWRDVPVELQAVGERAQATAPKIAQLVVRHENDLSGDALERKLYIARRLAEREVESLTADDASQFYVASFSSRTLVYKGMLLGSQLAEFYRDLGDEAFESPFALVHQRYSTNTLPTWSLAHPFRFVAHNGEINTLRGNINQMRAREADLASPLFGDRIDALKPVINERGSDSAIFDNVLELLVQGGRPLAKSMMIMVPEPTGNRFLMSADKRAFYEYYSAVMEPWDGPAAMMFSDGRYLGAVLDRNGLRPARYTITHDGLVVVASETGVLDIPPGRIQKRGRVSPGRMFLVDLEQHRIVPDHEIKSKIVREHPYRHWIAQNEIDLKGLFQPSPAPPDEPEWLLRKQHAFGYTEEDAKLILTPMAAQAQEPVGSMGNDAALPILSERPQLIYSYFKQLFAQVTNPPIDPLREELVMSLSTWAGPERNILDETPEHAARIRLDHPILSPADIRRLRQSTDPRVRVREIDMLFTAGDEDDAGPHGLRLEKRLDEMCAEAERLIATGVSFILLTDRRLDAEHAAVPSLLAVAALHHHLIRKSLRTRVSLVVESGDAREVMHIALLLGYGATAICPHVAISTIRSLTDSGRLDSIKDHDDAIENYITALKKGLMKTMSRMGISTMRSYFAAQMFEAVGLSRGLVERYFTGTSSMLSGIGIEGVAAEVIARHRRAFPAETSETEGRPAPLLDIGGLYQVRKGGEKHLWGADTIRLLQKAVREDDFAAFRQYTGIVDDQSRERATLRSLFRFASRPSITLEEVEPADNIMRRFVTAAMSFGSISKEAHETIAVALNRVGGRSNSGEGGEDPARFKPLPNGDTLRSKIKQVASGRFGVTTEYLINADELQIKIAQGAKPGEGGQLPGFKVTGEIARVRHTTPGVTLISPPPHHDIYSIEDLAQLIYDLKTVNPRANVSVKLVSEVGVGTIAAGVAKARADLVLISGHDGGTGASPITSIMHAGTPWELGLAEAQQALVFNGLRDRITVQVDGQLKTGRDIAVAALMGAEEFGFGTTVLVSMGCIMMRKCHLNTCPVGVATQDPVLRDRFVGKPEHVERFLRFIAEETRVYMAQLGFRTLDEMVGRTDCLQTEQAVTQWKARGLDLSPILMSLAYDEASPPRRIRSQSHDVMESLDAQLLDSLVPSIEQRQPVWMKLPIRNTHRTVGAMISGEVTRIHGAKGLPPDTIRLQFKGSAGQSLGAFLAPGVSLAVEGDANDYVGKGMSGGRVVITPPWGATFAPHDNAIVGNTVLYGATGGEVFISGTAGARFAVRNSGALAVVEGVGDHGCEYMTGGTVVVLGATGYNFAAGMSGGIAYVYDESELFDTRCNLDMVDLETVWRPEDRAELRRIIETHYRLTRSPRAEEILSDWDVHVAMFVKVIPLDYRAALARQRLAEASERDAMSATEEVFRG